MLDGKITDDSAPLSKQEFEQYQLEDRALVLEQENKKREKKPSKPFYPCAEKY